MHNWHSILGRELGASVVGRDASLLRDEEWQRIDDEVVDVIRRQIVARPLLARMGAFDTETLQSVETEVKYYERNGRVAARTDMTGQPENIDAGTYTPKFGLVPIHHAESLLPWRALEISRLPGGQPIDLSDQADAAAETGLQEDNVFLTGDSDLGIDGLLGPTGGQSFAGTSWSAASGAGAVNAYNDVNTALNKVESENIFGEGVLFLNPNQAKDLRGLTSNDRTGLSLVFDSDLVDQDNVLSSTAVTVGEAHFVVVNRRYVKGYLGTDFVTEEYTVPGKDVGLTTWAASTIVFRRPKASVKITGIA